MQEVRPCKVPGLGFDQGTEASNLGRRRGETAERVVGGVWLVESGRLRCLHPWFFCGQSSRWSSRRPLRSLGICESTVWGGRSRRSGSTSASHPTVLPRCEVVRKVGVGLGREPPQANDSVHTQSPRNTIRTTAKQKSHSFCLCVFLCLYVLYYCASGCVL